MNGIRQFCESRYFCFEILFNSVCLYSQFFSNLLKKIYANVKTPKRKLGSFVLRYSFKLQARSPKLKTGYRYENQFWNPGFTNGLTQFCRYRYFCFEILFYLILYILPFLSNLLDQNLHKE